jgi:hypothetical protein
MELDNVEENSLETNERRKRIKFTFIILVCCLFLNFFIEIKTNLAPYGYLGFLLGSAAVTIGSIGIPLFVYLIYLIFNKIKGHSYDLRSFEIFAWWSVIFATLNTIPNVVMSFVNSISQ